MAIPRNLTGRWKRPRKIEGYELCTSFKILSFELVWSSLSLLNQALDLSLDRRTTGEACYCSGIIDRIEYGFYSTLFIKNTSGHFMAVLVYVDDVLVTGDCIHEITQVKKTLDQKFTIKDMGEAKHFLGIEVCKAGTVWANCLMTKRSLITFSLVILVSDIQKNDKIKAKTDKTEHGMEKRKKSKSTKVKVKDGAKTEEMLNGPTRTHNGPDQPI
nr:retrovirus-related Pol polyprotein from transposon TNT 1-94 [Tanacetum cinerariifolium]